MAKKPNEKTGESTEYLLANVRAEITAAKRRAGRPPISVMLGRAAAGEDFAVMKQFKGNGRTFQRGEIIHPHATEDAWMIEHGFAIPLSVATDAEKAQRLQAFYRDEVFLKEARYREATSVTKRAVDALESARYQVMAATEALRLAEGQETANEDALRASLERLQQLAI